MPTRRPDAIQSPTSRFWRIVFWIVCVHFILGGIITCSQLQQSWNTRILRIFPWRSVGIPKAMCLWFFENSPFIWFILLLADVPAIHLIWNLARRQRSSRALWAYLLFIAGTLTLHFSAIAYLATLEVLRTPEATYIIEREIALIFGIINMLLALPAWLILVGILIVKPALQTLGLCASCGYDLRANKDKCPECGSPITPHC